jgi:hypothetical protein
MQNHAAFSNKRVIEIDAVMLAPMIIGRRVHALLQDSVRKASPQIGSDPTRTFIRRWRGVDDRGKLRSPQL